MLLPAGKEKVDWFNQRARGTLRLCGKEQTDLHRERETEGTFCVFVCLSYSAISDTAVFHM